MNKIMYQIKSMRVVNSYIDAEKYVKEGKMQIRNTISFTMSVDEGLLLCKHNVILKYDESIFVDVTLDTTFALTSESIEGLKSDKKIEIPQGFLVQCGSISYGTLRGIILKITNDTGFEDIIIPAVFINTIIKEPMVIEMD